MAEDVIYMTDGRDGKLGIYPPRSAACYGANTGKLVAVWRNKEWRECKTGDLLGHDYNQLRD